ATSLLPLFPFTTPAAPQISTLSLHDALPICLDFFQRQTAERGHGLAGVAFAFQGLLFGREDEAVDVAAEAQRIDAKLPLVAVGRSEEHTSELQSRGHLVCRLLLEEKQVRGGC